jgi:transposase
MLSPIIGAPSGPRDGKAPTAATPPTAPPPRTNHSETQKTAHYHWHRFRPESLGPFLGLTPSENSSGERRRQGAITKAGNTHARRLLIEAAWHHRRPSRLSVTLERRRTGKPLAVRAQADRSARRLHGRWQALEARGKPRSIVVVAVARELAGHCWALATME